MKWIIATSALLIVSQPAFSQQQRTCQQGDIGQTGITGCRNPDRLGAQIDQSGSFNGGSTNFGAGSSGSGGPTVVPNDPLANGLNPNPLVGSPGTTGLGTAGPQARIPSQATSPSTSATSPTGTGGAAIRSRPRTHRSIGVAPRSSTGGTSTITGTGSAGTTGATTVPRTYKHSGRKMFGSGITTGSTSVPSTSMGSNGNAVGMGKRSHRIAPMGGNHAIRSRSHSHR